MRMLREIVELDCFHLTSNTCPQEILATSKALFTSPIDLSSLGYPSNLDALTSGHVWVARGINCALNIQVFVNNQRLPVPANGAFSFIEKLGHSTLGAEIWSKLSLCTSLHIPEKYPVQAEDADFSLSINRGIGNNSLKSTVLENVNVRPPDNILHVSFERLDIQLRFIVKGLKKKKVKQSPVNSYVSGEISLEEPSTHGENTQSQKLQCLIRNGSDLSALAIPPSVYSVSRSAGIDACLNFQAGDYSSILVAQIKPLKRKEKASLHRNTSGFCRDVTFKAKYPEPVIQRTKKFARVNLKSSTKKMDGLFQTQSIKFQNNAQNNIELDLLTLGQEIPLAQRYPSLSKSSGIEVDHNSLSNLTDNQNSSLKRLFSNSSQSSLLENNYVVKIACKLAEVILNLVITGQVGQERQGISVLKHDKRHQKVPLSKLVPSIFTSDFPWLIANNSQYLPTINHVFSTSLVQNCLSPSLRNKLLQIFSISSIDEFETISRQAPRILDASLWVMLQNKLYDPSNGKRIWLNNNKPAESKPIRDCDPFSSAEVFEQSDSDWKDIIGDGDQSYDSFDDVLSNQVDPDLLNDGKEHTFKTEKQLHFVENPEFLTWKDSFPFDMSDEDVMLL